MFLYYIYKFVTYNKLKNHDSLIINTLCSNRGINHNKIEILHNYPNIIEYLDNRYTDSSSIEETIKRIKLNIEEKPKCPYCGAPVIFIGKKTKMFTKYCSNSCRSKDISKYIWQEGQKKYNLEHYGKECNFQIDKCKEKRVNTLIEKYGTSIIYDIPEFRKKRDEKWNKHKKEYQEYHNQIMLKLHGCTFSTMMKMPEFQQKRIDTMRKRGTFNTSKPEEESYELIKKVYPDVIRQYKCERYPWCCDFYIPSKDLFIECNYHWTHGGHPYNENNTLDVELLNKWKESTKYYNNAATTWSVYDVNKRKLASINKINYIEFWNINELKDWLNGKSKDNTI